MTFAFLPNYFKKIGIACFFLSIAAIIIAAIVVTTGALYTYGQEGGHLSSYMLGYKIGQSFAQENSWIIQSCSILLMLSMVFYMLAKEKIDDEYMDAIRWESLRLSVILSIIATIMCILLSWKLQAKTILFLQFTTYLITFKVKKWSAKRAA